jgi:hypothetical protein
LTWQASAGTTGPLRRQQGEKDKKRTMLLAAKRPSGLAPGRNQRHRVTRVNDRSYAVTDPKAYFAAGRAEEIISFSQKCCTMCNTFVKKINKHYAAAGETGFGSGTRPEQSVPRTSYNFTDACACVTLLVQ